MARKFGRRRWRRPERMTLEHPPVVRRKNLGPPDILIVRGDRPNAFAVGISPHAVVATTGSLNIEDLTLEAIIAHEIAHLRDGDATLSSLYVGLTSAPELIG